MKKLVSLAALATVLGTISVHAEEPVRNCNQEAASDQQFTLRDEGPEQMVAVRYRLLDRDGLPVAVDLASTCQVSPVEPAVFTPSGPVREAG